MAIPTPNHNLNPHLSTASYALIAVALVSVLQLRLLPALLAGLLVYAIVNAAAPGLQRHLPGERAHWFVVALLAAFVVGILSLAVVALLALLNSEHGNPSLLFERMMPLIERARTQLPTVIVEHLPADAEAIRAAAMDWLRQHAAQLPLAGQNAARAIVQLLIGIVLGAMLALHNTRPRPSKGPLPDLLSLRCANLVMAFRNVVFAQVKISALNTLLTGLFLLVVLPLFGVKLPLAKTLVVVTFIVGLLPVIGNLISNTLIFIVGMSISFGVAVTALVYLILIHKLEYFLNARIVGSQIRARAWEILIAMLCMEAMFGIPGLVAAPIYYAYLKRELKAAELIR